MRDSVNSCRPTTAHRGVRAWAQAGVAATDHRERQRGREPDSRNTHWRVKHGGILVVFSVVHSHGSHPRL